MNDFTQKVKDNTFSHIFEGTDLNLEPVYVTYSMYTVFKGSSDPSNFIFEINVGKSRI